MVVFAVGLILGVALGVLVAGFLAVGAFERGYDEALFRRREWRAEILARQAVAARTFTPLRKAS